MGKVSCKHHLTSTKMSPWRFTVQTTRLGRHKHCYDICFHIHSHYNVYCTFCCKHIWFDSPPKFHKPLWALISGHFSHLAKFSCKHKRVCVCHNSFNNGGFLCLTFRGEAGDSAGSTVAGHVRGEKCRLWRRSDAAFFIWGCRSVSFLGQRGGLAAAPWPTEAPPDAKRH